MKFRINETGEVKELKVIDTNGIEWTSDLLGNHDALHYNREDEIYTLDQDDFEWWEEFINDNEADEREVEALADEFDIELDTINNRIMEALQYQNDIGDIHLIKQNVFEEIREENSIPLF